MRLSKELWGKRLEKEKRMAKYMKDDLNIL